jgi:hypothetical protein
VKVASSDNVIAEVKRPFAGCCPNAHKAGLMPQIMLAWIAAPCMGESVLSAARSLRPRPSTRADAHTSHDCTRAFLPLNHQWEMLWPASQPHKNHVAATALDHAARIAVLLP